MSQLSLSYVGAPYVRGSDTSKAAAEHIVKKAGAIRERVYAYIAAQPSGATCDEVEAALGLSHQTASARVRDIAKANRITDTGQRRPTRSGCAARVYRVVQP